MECAADDVLMSGTALIYRVKLYGIPMARSSQLLQKRMVSFTSTIQVNQAYLHTVEIALYSRESWSRTSAFTQDGHNCVSQYRVYLKLC